MLLDTTSPATTVANVLAATPVAARVFARHKIDFCCGGKQSLVKAAEAASTDVATLLREIADEAVRPDDVDWSERSLGELVDHIIARYHRPLDQELPRLETLAQKVCRAHGGGIHEVVLGHVLDLTSELVPHMQLEEVVLFPMIAAGHGSRVETSIRVMVAEHDLVGGILSDLRRATGGYALADGACGSWRALWQGLEALEADLHEHIQLENNVLLPRVAAAPEPRVLPHADVFAVLLTRRDGLLRRLRKVDGHLRSQASAETAAEDPGVVHGNDLVLERLSQSDRNELDAIDGAIRRIHAGSYGACTECHATVEAARLASIPWASRCFACESAVDSE